MTLNEHSGVITPLPPAMSYESNGCAPPDDACLVAACTEILTGVRSSDTICFLDSIMSKANPHKDLNITEPDTILKDLFGFTDDMMPKFDHTICSELGRLAEKLVTCVFEHTRGTLVSSKHALMDEIHARYDKDPIVVRKRSGQERTLKWKNFDFSFAREYIVEVKYRFNSLQNKQDQIEVARVYREMGYVPVWVHLSPDCQQLEDFLASGWAVYVGQDALTWIEDHTGIDFQDLLRKVATQPIIAERLRVGRERIVENLKAEVIRDIEYGARDVRDHIYTHLAASDQHANEIMKRRGDLSEQLRDQIKRKSEDLMDDEIGNLPDLDTAIGDLQRQINDTFERLDDVSKTKTLRQLAMSLTDRQLDDFIATCG